MTSDPAAAGTRPTDARSEVALPGPLGDEIVRQSLDAIITTDAAFRIRSWNPAAERIYGLPAGDALGRRMRDIVDSLDLDGSPFDAAAAEASLTAGGSWRSRIVHRPRIGERAGRDIVIESVVALLASDAGERMGVVAINRDVTATASLESEIAALGSLVVATGRARSSTEVAEAALEILVRATGADAGLVTAMDSAYEATAQLGVAPATIRTIVSYGQLGGPLARALEAPDAYVSADVATAPLREDVREAVLADGIRHLIVVGLRLSGQLTGILAIGWRREAPLEPSRGVMLQAAALIASSLENARLISAVERGLDQEQLLTRRMRALVELTQLPAVQPADLDVTALLVDVRHVLEADAALYARIDDGSFVLTAVDDPRLDAARPFIDRPIDVFPVVAELRRGASAVIVPAVGAMTTPDGGAAVAAEGFRTIAVFALHDGEALAGAVFVGFARPIESVEVDDRTLEAIGRIVDISFANRRLREIVAASERRYRELFESAPQPLVVATRELEVVDANPAAIRLFGDGLIGTNASTLVVGEPATLDLDGEPEALRVTATGRRLDGSTFPEEIELRSIDVGGERRYLAMVRDLTEETLIQSELIQAQKMEAIGLLVAGVAHELNNPLASIVAFSQLIRTDPALPDDLRTQSDLLVQEANRTRVIVQNLLDFARQRPPERVRTDLRALVDSALGLQSYVLSRAGVSVEVAIPDGLPPLLVDRSQLQQVLINLTFNSVQAIRDAGRSGRIRIEAEGLPAGDPRRVRIAIRDDGPGVAADVIDRVFMPFVTTKAPGEGTGLGLSVSFGIVSAHGGSLRHEPTPGGGATFVIELPVGADDGGATATRDAPSVPATPPAEPPPEAAPGGPIRVLVLDDEPAIRTFLARALERSGYEPVLASSGPAALETIRSEPPAAILCDHRMAGMSGTEFHAAVERIDPVLARRFAFMSGDVLNPDLRAFAGERGVHLLAKPFDIATVGSLVATLLAETPTPS